MRNVIILGYVNPYHGGAGGRIPGLASELAACGWNPIVVTRELPPKVDLGCRVVTTSYRHALAGWLRLFRLNPETRIKDQLADHIGGEQPRNWRQRALLYGLQKAREVLDYPDIYRGWRPYLLQATTELLQNEPIDAMISTSPPVTAHMVAAQIKRDYGLPWLADFPHLWSQNNSYPFSELRRFFDRRLEQRVLKSVDALTSTSTPFTDKIARLHPGKPTHAIPHGFSAQRINDPPAPLTKKFSLTYPGTWDPQLREPSKLLATLRHLIDQGEIDPADLEVRFYGRVEPWLGAMIRQWNLQEVVRQHPPVPPDAVWPLEIESQVLLLPKWLDPNELGVHSIKFFEYLAARRPILAFDGFPDVTDDVMQDTRAGFIAPYTDTIETALKAMYREYRKTGVVNYSGDIEAVSRYSHREMARRFAVVLDQIAAPKASGAAE